MWGEKMSNCWDQSGTLRPTNDLLLGEKCYVGEKRGVEKWCSGGERSYFVEKVSCLGGAKWYFEEQVAYLLLQGGVLGKKGDALGSMGDKWRSVGVFLS